MEVGGGPKSSFLIPLSLLEESYPAEIARLLGAGLYSVQAIVDALDKERIVATRSLGRTRKVTLNPRFAVYRELKGLLQKLAEGESNLRSITARRRSRPRRKGKEI